MTPAELQKILQSDDKLTVKQVKEIIWQLKNDCFNEINNLRGEKQECEKLNFEDCGVDSINRAFRLYLEEKFYNGEANAFYICLDLLEKVEDNNEKL